MFPTLESLSGKNKKLVAPTLTTRAPSHVDVRSLDVIEAAFFAQMA